MTTTRQDPSKQSSTDARSERAIIDCMRASYEVIHAYTTTPRPSITREVYSDACEEFNANTISLVRRGFDFADIAMLCALWSQNRAAILKKRQRHQLRERKTS